MIKRVHILFVCLLVTSLLARSEENKDRDWAQFGFYAADNEVVRQQDASIRAVFYGNSITYGWYQLHPEFFRENGFIGRGISGQTSSELLVRMRQDVIGLHPQTVVILCGTNDIARNNGRISPENAMGNIISMCELAIANDIRPILCSILPARSFWWNTSIEDAPRQIAEFNVRIKEYAEKSNITYVDYYSSMVAEDGGLLPGLSDDEVHPNMNGYELMESIIAPIFSEFKSQVQRKE